MSRKMLIMFAVSLGFFFVTATTFTSLGYVLYMMVDDLGWSQAAAGASFALLGLACGLGSPLPPMLMKWLGTRATLAIGGAVLGSGFFLASASYDIGVFFLATTLMGVGFSLIAPSPGVFLIATWLPEKSGRLMGIYFMSGALGGVFGPLIVNSIVTLSGSWRVHWAVMGMASCVLSIIFLLTIRDAVNVESTDQVKHAGKGAPSAATGPGASPWTVRSALMTSTFLMIALAMLVVQTAVTTMHSVLVTHVASFGMGSAPGAWAMSCLAMAGTFSKGITGALTERFNPRTLLIGGLFLQAVAIGLLSVGSTPAMAIGLSLLFGFGWGFAWLAAHILLLRYFGAAIAGDLTAMATMATTFAVLGPLSAGWVADETGSFVPMFIVFSVLLLVVTLTSLLFLRAPSRRTAGQQGEAENYLVPAE